MLVCMKQRLITINPDRDWSASEFSEFNTSDESPTNNGTRPYYMRQAAFAVLDERSSESGKGRDEWHPFSHYKKVALPHPLSVFDKTEKYESISLGFPTYRAGILTRTVDVFNCSTFGQASSPTVGMPALFSLDSSGDLLIDPPENLESILGVAFQRLLPGIKPQLSFVNSILELKDFISLRETVSHAESILRRLIDLNNFRRAAFAGLSFREIARRRSSDYLQWKFNLAPLYSDIKGIFNSFKSYQAQVMRLIAQAEKPNRRHTGFSINDYAGYSTFDSEPGFHSVNSGEFDAPQKQLHTQARSHRAITYEASKFHVEMEYCYSFSKFQVEHARLFAILDNLGVNFNPAIVWNAIRWTFVVDWVFGVSRFLNQYSERNMEPVVIIRRCLWSIKRSRSIKCSFDLLNGLAANPASEVTETAYRRSLCLPTSASLLVSGLSPEEVSLGAALILVRRPRHPST